MNFKRFRLDALDQSVSLTKEAYAKDLKKYQLGLLNLQLRLKESKRSVIVVIEGPDAAGKGGAIKRTLEFLDPRLLRALTRRKNRRPRNTATTTSGVSGTSSPLTARSPSSTVPWYGRVLVERVEGFATEAEWKRAFGEINEMERTLADDGAILIKLYLHVSKDEQLRRFKERQANPDKHWKINGEDWRNRRKWNQHNAAAEDMFVKTSTRDRPVDGHRGRLQMACTRRVRQDDLRAHREGISRGQEGKDLPLIRRDPDWFDQEIRKSQCAFPFIGSSGMNS